MVGVNRAIDIEVDKKMSGTTMSYMTIEELDSHAQVPDAQMFIEVSMKFIYCPRLTFSHFLLSIRFPADWSFNGSCLHRQASGLELGSQVGSTTDH